MSQELSFIKYRYLDPWALTSEREGSVVWGNMTQQTQSAGVQCGLSPV